jgi:beta-barrel assembly-enhancing protease
MSRWRLLWLVLLAALTVPGPLQAAAQRGSTSAGIALLAGQEAQLLTIYHRLAVAAAPWCEARPLSGILLRDVRQYRGVDQAMVRDALALAPDSMLYVAAVARGSAAEAAGLRVGDGVAGIGGAPVDPAAGASTRSFLDQAETQLMAGARFQLTVPGDLVDRIWIGERGCAAFVQVSPRNTQWPVADGQRISVPPSLFARVGDDGAVASVAHELSHIILHHAEARNAARRLPRQARMEAAYTREFAADRLAIWVLHRAGYDPQAMGNLLRLEGEQSGNAGRIYPNHPSWEERVRRAEAALVEMRSALAVDPHARPF